MKTSFAVLILCVAPLLTTSFPFERKGSSPTSGGGKEKRVQYAAWDDVNVLAHGLLQLGQGLKEHVDKTKVQIRDISTKLKILNRTVTEFGKESQKLQREGEALKDRARGLEDREASLLNVTVELRDKAEEMRQDGKTLVERVGRLEEKVEGLAQGEKNGTEARSIQLMLEAQNKRIDDLMERIRLQQEKLDKQNVRIRTLQTQIQQSRQRVDAPRNPSHDEPSTVVEQRDSPAVDTASDCHELFLRGESTSGVYTIQPLNSEPFQVYCEMTSGGGWTVIQRRQDGSVDFHQPWEAYERGFGNLKGEFWLGLEKMHSIAKDGGYVMNIAMSDWNGDLASVRLSFNLGGPNTKYSLYVKKEGPFSPLESSLGPDATDALPFSTSDQDNDRKNDANCAMNLSGGWWFSSCGQSNLNGRYFQSPPPKQRHQRKQGIFWKTWRGRYYPLRSTTMMIAPAEIQESRS
ncbi:angiopoietin-related protein 4 [Periophthalmus magnuspinnatus]|uniref:angiopoietin-related protein 4 n=1 Tax=Periophthalmus magnuspinnatus TaxID=409849 RepID=UPI00145AB356|nr:angiopoietin-related protein 4 [Periophthalmus magnuspinnatus]